jgi:hypothetical protein
MRLCSSASSFFGNTIQPPFQLAIILRLIARAAIARNSSDDAKGGATGAVNEYSLDTASDLYHAPRLNIMLAVAAVYHALNLIKWELSGKIPTFYPSY